MSSDSRPEAAQDLVVARPAADRIEQLDDPTPGTYWRVRKNVRGRDDDRMETNPLRRGLVLMLAEVEYADGAPHVYRFAPHPSWRGKVRVGSRVHADDFYAYFEPAPDFESVRARELVRLLAQMEDTKRLMLEPPPNVVPAGLLAHDPMASVGAEGRELATADQLRSISAYADTLKEDAERRSTWIKKHSGDLGAQGTMLANFHQERAEAGLARATAQLEGVKGLLKTVENLRLYTGEGIDLLQLRDGVPASADAPVTVYQDVLSLDEEALILLDQGGLDHTQTEALMDALKDPALLNRLIPAERGIVLVQFRRTYKEFITVSEGADFAQKVQAGLFNANMSIESKRKRLLVRDGERLWLVDADSVLSGIKQLMPSAGEQAGYYERDRWSGKADPITRDDLDYAKAQREQIGALDRYGQVLVLLWGLHDRVDLFEAAAIPKFTNWLDPAFQGRYLRLVSIDTLIGVSRPTFAAWRSSQNEYLVSGCWVAVDLKTAFTRDNAPGAFSNGSFYNGKTHYERFYKPALEDGSLVLIERARADKDGLFVEVRCVYDGYRDVSRRYTKIKLRIAHGRRAIDGALVLDRVRSADLSYYLESRQERRSYADFIQLFREARAWVAERDAAEAPLRHKLRAAVQDGRLAHDPDALDGQITTALAVARTARRDKAIPATGTASFRAFVEAALSALHAQLTDNSGRVEALEAWAASNERVPLRLVLTGRDEWKVYLVPLDSEHDSRLGEMTHASVARVSFASDGGTSVAVFGREMLRPVTGEQVIHDWNREVPRERADYPDVSDFMFEHMPATRTVGAAEWLAKEPLFQCSYEEARSRLDAAIAHSEAFDAGIDVPSLIVECRRWMHASSKKYVLRMPLHIAIGSALTRKGTPLVLMAQVDALSFAFHAGNDDAKQACRDVVRGIYKRKEEALRALEAAPVWHLAARGIDRIGAIHRSTVVSPDVDVRLIHADVCVPPGKSFTTTTDVRVTAVTATGVRLLPWLAGVTLSALDNNGARGAPVHSTLTPEDD